MLVIIQKNIHIIHTFQINEKIREKETKTFFSLGACHVITHGFTWEGIPWHNPRVLKGGNTMA